MSKKIIRILIFIVCIICIVCLIILNRLNKEGEESVNNNVIIEVQDTLNPDGIVEEEYNIEKERNATRFFTIQSCIQKYVDNVKDNNIQIILDILDSQYIKDNNISESNIENYINTYQGDTFTAKEIEILRGDRIFQYRVYGFVTNEEGRHYMYFKVTTDTINRTFEIQPMIEEGYNSLEQIPLEKASIDTIEKNDNNVFTYQEVNPEEICRIYQRYYTELETTNIEEAYEMLNAEYREKRFPTIDDFKVYVEDNREVIEQATMASYSINRGTNSTIYTIQDSYNNQYILEEESIMNFTIKLDSYTILDATYEESYAELPESEKASANVGIFIQMINAKDYVHAYEKLAEGFKENNFQTVEQFKDYVRNNWHNVNKYTINSYRNEGNVYIFDVSLKNIKELREDSTISKTFNVLLGEGTDFTLSFNVN